MTSGNMAGIRVQHTATLLNDGTVLIAGGWDGTGYIYQSAEIFDPSTQTFAPTGSMTTARSGHSAVLLTDGTVLIVGGGDGQVSLSSAEVYDAVGSGLVIARLSDGRVLIAGGADHDVVTNSAEIYDPNTKSFRETSGMAIERYSHTATLLSDGRVLIAGGRGRAEEGSRASAEIFDPQTETFTRSVDMAARRAAHTATRLGDGKVLIVGGYDYNPPETAFLVSAEIFDPVTERFTATAGYLAFGRADFAASLLANGTVLVTGGDNIASCFPPCGLTSAELYDPAIDGFGRTWTMNARRYVHSSTTLQDGRVLVAGGLIGQDIGGLASAEVFEFPPMNTPTGTSVAVEPSAGTPEDPVVTFDAVTFAGTTSVIQTSTTPALPSGFTLAGSTFDISTTAAFSGNIEVCFTYSAEVADPRVLHYESGSWVDRTVQVDTVHQVVCASVTSLSPFAIVQPWRLTELVPASLWIGLKNSDDVGTKFDLLAEVLKNGNVIGSGQLNGIGGGSSGFNNAILRAVTPALAQSVSIGPGNSLSIRVSVRIAINVAGHSSGIARLWFNDSAANSRFGATIAGASNTYYLVRFSPASFALTKNTAGTGPKSSVDVFVSKTAGGNAFKPFGTWSIVVD